VRLVRSLGFDSIWAGEHHITPGFHFFPQLPLLHRLAGEAEGLWIGTNVTLLPLHNPVELAEAGAFLDVITGGKFLLGVGLGYRPEEYQIFGVPMSARVSRFTEAVEIIRRLWSEDRVTHSARHWQFSDAAIAPRPLQAPRPPIIIGAQVDAAIARAAKIGDGWLSVPLPTLDQLDAQMSVFKSARSAAKLPPAEHFCRLIEVGCATDDDTAIRRSIPFLMEKYKSYSSWGLEGLARFERHPRATVPRAGVQAVCGGRACKCHRYAGRPTSPRYQPPLDAGELAGDGPGRDPRQHRASWPQGSSHGAAPNGGRGAVAPPSKAAADRA
jgi:alkanesulfonate monooxygenase SsuD/methylene tetrahydromethanopterin reductase-like flavin-dependent oxidoreductase (luciferase family)